MSEEEISIKLNICDRFFPLRVKASDEENYRSSTKLINERAKHYITNNSLQDYQDALSLVALEFTSKTQEQEESGEFELINKKLKELETLLDI